MSTTPDASISTKHYLSINPKDIDALKNGTWECYLSSMTVKSGNGEIVIQGPGFIQQNGQKYFKVVIFNTNTTNAIDVFMRQINGQTEPGQIIPSEKRYELVSENENWRCLNMSDPGFDSVSNAYTFYVTEIYCQGQPRFNNKISSYYIAFQEYKNFPKNETCITHKYLKNNEENKLFAGRDLCATDKTFENYKMKLFYHDGITEYDISTDKSEHILQKHLEYRAIEALEYLIGVQFEWNIKCVRGIDNDRIYYRLIENRANCYSKKPLNTSDQDYFEPFWDMYYKYLTYILQDQSDNLSKTGYVFRNLFALRSSRHFLSTYALSLSVAIEDLIKDKFAKIETNADRNKLIEGLILLVESYCNENNIASGLSSMIVNHLSKLNINQKKEHAGKVLKRLFEEGKISEDNYKNWNAARGTTAHGEEFEFNQKNINTTGKMETLLNQLIFILIGYEGAYTNYGQIGYPIQNYPKEL